MPHPLLTFDNVSFSYNGSPVLKDVSFTINEGEFVGFIGPNGGGKTTLFKLILGFLKPTQGKIILNGKPLGYVPQTLHFDKLFPISTLEVVMGGLLKDLPWYGKFSPSDTHRAQEALHQVGLEPYASRQFGTLSMGQAQRALIARALVSKPKILLLDEPTASVDAQSEAEIHEILFSLNKKITVLMVTHDIRAIIEGVQRVICVQGGVFSLQPNQVCEHFALGVYHTPLVKLKES